MRIKFKKLVAKKNQQKTKIKIKFQPRIKRVLISVCTTFLIIFTHLFGGDLQIAWVNEGKNPVL